MTKNEIIDWLTNYSNVLEKNIIFNEDNSVNINQTIDIYNLKIKELPFKFNVINGDFMANDIGLISFKNFPNYITKSFSAYGNDFQSTNEIPLKVFGNEYFITGKKNNINLDFISKLECSEDIELVLSFDDTEFITNDFMLQYKWILNLTNKQKSKDMYLTFKEINIIKKQMELDKKDLDTYLNDFLSQNIIKNIIS